ncbi:hypothetical protein SAMN05216203_1842 [Marinobacter daqiaonensis]|uniref:Uncharacterized protein n=1 Tax=Marinobacter daqiaonensis TaxID=650891 RepID=A0A1I6I5F1_9GAMM|nr:hypothetical protein SAMN05216203_1842 [Marinobacter daqiaonensis]
MGIALPGVPDAEYRVKGRMSVGLRLKSPLSDSAD